jgi:kynurenine formamidase
MVQVTGEQALGYIESLSNWGRWGPDDRLGTLNLVTSASTRAAAGLVTDGLSVSCAHDIDPTVLDPIHQFHRYMVVSGEGLADPHRVPHMFGATPGQRWSPSREYLGMVFHGALVTHLDALSHMAWDAKTYNGYPAERVNSVTGAIDLPVSAITAGVTTRGVLFDVPRSRGVDALPPGTAVEVDELERLEAEQGVIVGEGDVVLLRTGKPAEPDAAGAQPSSQWNWRAAKSGWAASCLPWFRERGVAMIGHDGSNDTFPAPEDYEKVGLPNPIHVITLVVMGLWMIDNMALEELGATCSRLNRWEFMLHLAPMRLLGGTGAPVNPVATF